MPSFKLCHIDCHIYSIVFKNVKSYAPVFQKFRFAQMSCKYFRKQLFLSLSRNSKVTPYPPWAIKTKLFLFWPQLICLDFC